MPKYRVTFEDKKMVNLEPIADNRDIASDAHEERTGSILTATFEAANEQEAQEKARKLETELKTGMTKEQLERRERNSPQ
ncbi:MAG: hypothetical protein JSS82_10165 [Bacteroidetes bacterium]|nr:hypothetical protein [Bacteroidota bacterium]